MASVNKVTILGRLGKDPELTSTPSGKQVCKFSVATSKKYNGKEHTEWHNIVAWNKTAELCSQYLAKGSQCYLEGELQTRSWETDSGQKRYATDIVANSVQFLGGKGDKKDFNPGDREGLDDIPF